MLLGSGIELKNSRSPSDRDDSLPEMILNEGYRKSCEGGKAGSTKDRDLDTTSVVATRNYRGVNIAPIEYCET